MFADRPPRVTVAAFYKFVRLEDRDRLRESLQAACRARDLAGTILLAGEGINGTVAGADASVREFVAWLRRDERFTDTRARFSAANEPPFHRLQVKLKSEIVALGVPEIDPTRATGDRVAPQDWNALLDDPEVTAIDTRNQFEYEIGSFERAISPETDRFREFPDFVADRLDPTRHKKIAMFCTGGIRCEKASAYLLQNGFQEVYKLDGGILHYLETCRDDSRWYGECFVFDARVAVDANLQPGTTVQCYACRRPLTERDRATEHYEPGISCPHCYADLTDEQRAKFTERRRQVALAARQQRKHVGAVMPKPTGPKPAESGD